MASNQGPEQETEMSNNIEVVAQILTKYFMILARKTNVALNPDEVRAEMEFVGWLILNQADRNAVDIATDVAADATQDYALKGSI
jgi:hypothetical protein